MDIWQIDKLILFLLFFIPGFISTKVYNLLYPSEQKDFSAFLLEAIGYSSLNFAVLSWLIIIIHSGNFYNNHKVWYFICSFLILFIIPLLWPILFFNLSNWEFVKKYIVSPIQKPWDYVFRKKEVFWVFCNTRVCFQELFKHFPDTIINGNLVTFASFLLPYPEQPLDVLPVIHEMNNTKL